MDDMDHIGETGFDIVYKVMRNFFQFKRIRRDYDGNDLGALVDE